MRVFSNAARSAYAWPIAPSYQGVSVIQYVGLLILVGAVTITAVTLVVRDLPNVLSAVGANVIVPS
jgi:hypothetical protein